MKTNLLFDFAVDKDQKTIHIRREFNAELPIVWRAWTTAELLEKWWAPQPFTILTKAFEFAPGGLWHYAMVGPEPEKEMHWCRMDYKEIETERNFTALDAFCDEDGNINTEFSRMHWAHDFSQDGQTTTVAVVLTMDTLETLEKIMTMGFRDGFTMGLNQLESLLTTLS